MRHLHWWTLVIGFILGTLLGRPLMGMLPFKVG